MRRFILAAAASSFALAAAREVPVNSREKIGPHLPAEMAQKLPAKP